MHQRLRPVLHRFVYPVFCVRLDLARAAEPAMPGSVWTAAPDERAHPRLWPRDGSDLATWVRGSCARQALPQTG
jgi:DUF1365 family protein